MRVAVSALGPSLGDRVDERFGRAAYLLIVDDDRPDCEVVDNGVNRDALQGAGLGAAEVVSEHGATAVITGHLGPKAFTALQLSGVTGYDGTGMTVRSAVEELRLGRLARLTAGQAHSGMS
ncbi:MAG: NifB/NifX family molybdenum-iron cluster-binding protein [Thermoleophilia bacterium]